MLGNYYVWILKLGIKVNKIEENLFLKVHLKKYSSKIEGEMKNKSVT